MSEETKMEIPEEFTKIMKDFISDILNTFPEYQPIVDKWWKTNVDDIEDEHERENAIKIETEKKITLLYSHCICVFPERFFDILYQKTEIFDKESSVNTDFLPGISFKYLWQCDISDKTRETIWKYLQMILICIVGNVKNKEAFGDTTKLFEALNEDDFKSKLEETIQSMQSIFENMGTESNSKNDDEQHKPNIPSADDIQGHINNMLSGKLGDLAREIAEETSQNLNIDMEGVTDAKDVFQKLFQNPGKLMNMVKNVGDKLDEKMRSGEINQNELMSEASEMLNRMKNMPGMPNIQEFLSKMKTDGAGANGMPDLGNLAGLAGLAGLGKNAKVDVNAMKQNLERKSKFDALKERSKKKMEAKNLAKLSSLSTQTPNNSTIPSQSLNDEELLAFFSNKNNNTNNKTNNKITNNTNNSETTSKKKKKSKK
jgi:hypothetical protein